MDIDAGERPAFLDPVRAEAIGYIGADEVPNFDSELGDASEEGSSSPVEGVKARYQEIARMHAFGMTNNQICATLGYTATRVSILIRHPFVQEEIAIWRKRFFDGDAIETLKQAARDGAKRIHRIITDPKTKDTTVLAAAQFAIEKSHGKARQEVALESGTLLYFMEHLKEMQNAFQPLGAVDVTPALPAPIDVSPAAPQKNEYDAWLDEHLPR